MRPILRCMLLQNEVLQSPIRIKMISAAIRQVGCHPWQFAAPSIKASIKVPDIGSKPFTQSNLAFDVGGTFHCPPVP